MCCGRLSEMDLLLLLAVNAWTCFGFRKHFPILSETSAHFLCVPGPFPDPAEHNQGVNHGYSDYPLFSERFFLVLPVSSIFFCSLAVMILEMFTCQQTFMWQMKCEFVFQEQLVFQKKSNCTSWFFSSSSWYSCMFYEEKITVQLLCPYGTETAKILNLNNTHFLLVGCMLHGTQQINWKHMWQAIVQCSLQASCVNLLPSWSHFVLAGEMFTYTAFVT